MNLVTIDTSPGNMSMYIAPTNTKYLEMGLNASSVVIGPISQTSTRNVSTVINGVRIDSHVTNQNLLITQGNNKYNVTTSSYPTNVCNTIVSNIGFSVNNVTGDHCTAVGHNCLTNNSTGKYNIAIGADTLTNVTTGDYNTALGGIALNVATDSNQVAVGYNALGKTVSSLYPNVAVGSNSLANFNNSGAGANTAIGHSALGSLTSGTGNVAIGFLADNAPGVGTVNTTATNSICIGNQATSNNYGNCIAIGSTAFNNANNQIIIGAAGGGQTTWIQGSGGFNVNGGPTTLRSTTIYEPTGSVGTETTGSLVIDHGNAGGASSIVFPSRTNRTSDYGYIRYRDDVNNSGAESSRLEIGLENDGDDHLILQKGIGCVGIGIMNPSHKLHVSGNACVSGNIGIGTTDVTRPLTVNGLVSIGDGAFDNGAYGTVNITSTDRSYYQLALIRSGTIAWRLGTLGTSNDFVISAHYGTGGVKLTDAATSWASKSDRNLKNNFEDIEEPIKKINNIKGCYYKFKKDTSDTMRRVGVIAQDVQAVLPEAVSESIEDGQNILSVKYTELIPLLIEGIKSQQSHIEDLKSRISIVEARMAKM